MADVIQVIVEYADWLYVLCGLGVLVYLRAVLEARRERNTAIFTLEREAASSRAARSLVGMFVFISLAGSVFFVEEMLAPRLPEAVEQDDEAAIKTVFLITPTSDLATATPLVASPTPEPSATATRRPRPTLPPPTATPLPMAACSSIAQITSPRVGAVLSGQVSIFGTAAAPDFNFYKIEYHREGEPAEAWHSISDIHKNQVVNGLLDTWDVSGFPPGNYRLKLTVVDITGNYPPQNRCEVPVVISG
ncbi:MAG: hypothetical protein D6791_18855 [Chloroflexi bacterium]|nr:MAG: hypothetical protein D6791_18855 [Chloroflexota bacterium]